MRERPSSRTKALAGRAVPRDQILVLQMDEERAILGDVVEEGMTGLYAYDFGDDWEHDLLVEAVRPFDAALAYPICTGGARACPPDDCGGPHRYAEMLEILADPEHPEYREQRRWVGGFFDPEGFDANRINRDLGELHATARRPR